MGKVLIVRHGKCQANVDGVVAGAGNDSPLIEEGYHEAESLTHKLAGQKISRIVSSPLQRARATAEVVRRNDFPNVPIEINGHFTERHVGTATGLTLEEYFALEKTGRPIEGAESEQAMFNRVKVGLDELRNFGGITLLVTHNGTYRMIECVVQSRPATDFAFIEGLHNGEVREVDLL